jgi:ABC-type branched-subunit amino acid transport system substrate-binding protein
VRGSSLRGVRARRSTTAVTTALCSIALAATTLAGCSSTNSAASSSSGSSAPPIPSAAFSDHTGVTPATVTIANISTQTAGLFKGAAVGAEAYAAYVNSQGGVNGRKLVVDASDDQFVGSTNKQLTESAVQNDFASVGSFSTQDGFGGVVLEANPQMPNVSVALDPNTQKLANTYSVLPAIPVWPLGPLVYFKDKYPTKVLHSATIVADLPSTLTLWDHEKAAMDHLGYKVLYAPALPATTTDFTPQIVTMKDMGVQILFLEQEPQNYAAAIFKDLQEQNFHPVVVLGGASYSHQLVANSGGAAAVDGAYLEQQEALYLGEDAPGIPAVATFNTWVQKASPGFNPDLFTLEGWLCAQLFVQGLRNAGSNPSRGSEQEALRKVTVFDGDNLVPQSNPAEKIPSGCYIIGQVVNGTFQRLDNPPVDGPTHGFRCDQPLYYEK